MKYVFCLVLFLCISNTYAEVSIKFPDTIKHSGSVDYGEWLAGPIPQITNSTNRRIDLKGWRFSTPDILWDGFQGDVGAEIKDLGDLDGDGQVWQETQLTGIDSRILLPLDGTSSKGFSYAGKTLQKGEDGTPANPYLLVKTNAKGEVNIPIDSTIVLVDDIPSIKNNKSYSNPDYRYCDTGSLKIGNIGGAIHDNFEGETQVILPKYSDSIKVNNVKTVISPEFAGILYWISMVAVQEYYSIDYQFLSGIFAKETNAGTGSYPGYFDNSEQTYGCGEVEKNTFNSVALAYPHLFPEHEDKLQRTRSVLEFKNNVMDDSQFGSYYMGAGTQYLDSANVVTSIFASAHVFFWIWDYLAYSEKVCLKQSLEQHEDRYFIAALISLLYNRGLSYDRDSVIWINNYKDNLGLDAADNLDPGHENYREEILAGLIGMERASKRAMVDNSVEIYDADITLDHLKRFFFGEGGSVSNQGKGGLLMHFAVDRVALESDLEDAFNALSNNGSTISFRYDLLTLLRAVKKHMPYRRGRPLDSESQAFLMARKVSKGECGCDGDTIDTEFPFMDRQASSVESGFILEIVGSDDQGIETICWSKDPLWREWSNLSKISGDLKNCIYKVSINSSDISEVDSIWIKATDISGNSTIKSIAVENFGTVGIKKDVILNNFVFPIMQNDNGIIKVRLSKAFIGSDIVASLYSLNGKKITTLYKGEVNYSLMKFDLKKSILASGLKILKLKIDGRSISYKVKL